MAQVGMGTSLILRVKLDNVPGKFGELASALGTAGGNIGAIDILRADRHSITRDVTVHVRGPDEARRVAEAAGRVPGVSLVHVSDRTFLLHLGGKIEVRPRVPVKNRDDLSMVYTPGVARVCEAIAEDPEKAFSLTIKRNTVAVVSDGSAVLGLGNIGPLAALPVMEGKCLLFKQLAGVDAFPLCLDVRDPGEIVRTVRALAPAFGGINLEDIASPRCFEIEDALRQELDVPVFHDDQHGTAVVVLAGLINAVKIVGKRLEDLTVVVVGIGAAGVACTRMLLSAGVRNVIGCDREGAIHRGRPGLDGPVKQWYAAHTNPEGRRGRLGDVIAGADVFLGVSGPDVLTAADVRRMAPDPIVFALANPVPEIDPEEAARHARVVATGRSDFPNQINNCLCFPGLFKGVLECRAREIDEPMKLAAARAIAAVVGDEELGEEYIIPTVFNQRVVEAVAEAVAGAARRSGVARRHDAADGGLYHFQRNGGGNPPAPAGRGEHVVGPTGSRWVLDFAEGDAGMAALLGGKGAGLAGMVRLGLPVPPGFTVTTEAYRAYFTAGDRFPEGLEGQVLQGLHRLEAAAGRRFGDAADPLLVSVRSGAPASMPGMMDTILNLGLNDETVAGLAAATGDARFAYDCYRRLIQMFGDVVIKVDRSRFEALLGQARAAQGAASDQELTAGSLHDLVEGFKDLVRRESGRPFPGDPREQLDLAVRAVFDSWQNPRARVYRELHGIPEDMGTAVNIQAMVFGNRGADSGSGVLFTRDPSTGEAAIRGEFLFNAQGEDVVAGVRTPLPLARLAGALPDVHAGLVAVARRLEEHFGDVQDVEFTVERGRLYILQTRAAKRTARAAVKVARDLAAEGRLSRDEALLRVTPENLEKLMHWGVDPRLDRPALGRGLPASPGAAVGRVVFDPDTAEGLGRQGERVILVRPETSPDDIHGIAQAQGVLTSRGGMTCHAAIVARGMGKPCVVGAETLGIDLERRLFRVNGTVVGEGDVISIDGSTGRVFAGEVPLVPPDPPPELDDLLRWADEHRRLGVQANADTPEDARRARELGAEGIGLCRTEHMFLGRDRLPAIQEMILAETTAEREAALARLLPMQQADFEAIFLAMGGRPVTIRLLDPPLHEFLPDPEALAAKEEMLRRARALREANPMMGHRGCRLGISYPEVYEMQARAVCRAAAALARQGTPVRPKVMIPLVAAAPELATLRRLVERVAEEVWAETGVTVECPVGTMIEVPRAALTAGAIAAHADFFSFGTNDLTQMTYGFSRDDAEARFLARYLADRILPTNPFVTIDPEGVGRLIAMAVQEGRASRPGLEVGLCGEHGGDPASIAFCHRAGLDYVSCSPMRVPVARLAAAHAAIEGKSGAPVER